MSGATFITWWVVGGICLQVSYIRLFNYGDYTPLSIDVAGRSNLSDSELLPLARDMVLYQILGETDSLRKTCEKMYAVTAPLEYPQLLNNIGYLHRDMLRSEDLPKSFHNREFLEEWISKGGWNGMTDDERVIACINDPTIIRHAKCFEKYLGRVNEGYTPIN